MIHGWRSRWTFSYAGVENDGRRRVTQFSIMSVAVLEFSSYPQLRRIAWSLFRIQCRDVVKIEGFRSSQPAVKEVFHQLVASVCLLRHSLHMGLHKAKRTGVPVRDVAVA